MHALFQEQGFILNVAVVVVVDNFVVASDCWPVKHKFIGPYVWFGMPMTIYNNISYALRLPACKMSDF